ncbi:MAG: acyltransferase family protein [Bacteroidaceae bacterium]|nr:acyltransferase family protein [Bacteroidaceae bacterium]
MVETNRLYWIDWAKARGIILVVLGHMHSPLSHWIFVFHMPMFFMISGYLYKHTGTVSEVINLPRHC